MEDIITNLLAFVCEIGETHVKLFDIKWQLVTVSIGRFQERVSLGQFYEHIPRFHVYTSCDWSNKLQVFARTGRVHAKVLAFAPTLGHLPANLRKKYKNTAWSPFLQMLTDPDNILIDFPSSEMALVTVVYAPKGRRIFQVVGVEEPTPQMNAQFNGYDIFFASAPWLIEARESVKLIYAVPPPTLPRFHQRRIIDRNLEFIGINLIKTHRREDENLLPADDDILYARPIGLLRAVNEGLEIGQWYRFQVLDGKTRRRVTGNIDHLTTIKALKIRAIEPPVYTKITRFQSQPFVQMTASFLFKYDMFERPSNRDMYWGYREQNMRDVHFHDVFFGKVLIDKPVCKEIIEKIEEYVENLKKDPVVYADFKDEQIAVEVLVQPVQDFLRKFQSDPGIAIFCAASLGRISYLIGGNPIHEC